MACTAPAARLLPWLCLAAGVAVAVAFSSVNAGLGETGQAAIALLERGYIGDPYLLPTGPTAHVSPAVAWLLAAVFWLWGENTVQARIVLGMLAATLFALGARAALRLARVAGVGPGSAWIVGGLLALTPMMLFQAVIYNRQWDQPFAALILVQGWLVLESSRGSARPYRAEAALAALAGVGALFSPAIFPTLFLSLAVVAWRRRRLGDVRVTVLLCAGILAAALLPWGLRNERVMGRFMLTRSNFGLELDVGNAPGATGLSGSGAEAALHPHDWAPAARQVQAVGEVAYMDAVGGRARAWIAANPARFAWLTLRRFAFSFLPPPAMVGWTPLLGARLSWALWTAFGLLKVAALLAAAWFGARPMLVLLYGVLPMAPYFVTHINIRYELTTYFAWLVIIALAAQQAMSRRGWRAAAP